jgi:thiol-disulfide isomerase/thioredoxin
MIKRLRIFLYVLLQSLFFFNVSNAQESCITNLQQQRKEALNKLMIGTALYPIDSLSHKAVVVVFYKTDCPFCEKLMPELFKLQQKYGTNGFRVIAIALDEDLQEWKSYIKTNGYDVFTNFCDGKSFLGKFPEAYNVYTTPTLFLLDNDWKLYKKPKRLTDLVEDISELLTR